jgi:hypothetical protein
VAQDPAAQEPRAQEAVAKDSVGQDWVAQESVGQGWEACEFVAGEPDVSRQDDVLPAAIAFHAAIAHLARPAFLDLRGDPWSYGDRVAWEELPVDGCPAVSLAVTHAAT